MLDELADSAVVFEVVFGIASVVVLVVVVEADGVVYADVRVIRFRGFGFCVGVIRIFGCIFSRERARGFEEAFS